LTRHPIPILVKIKRSFAEKEKNDRKDDVVAIEEK
jgi:hypothetical protein